MMEIYDDEEIEFIDSDGNWQCIKCGACCLNVGSVLQVAYLDRGDRACKHLLRDNTCEIYDMRPGLCRVYLFNCMDHELIRACAILRRTRDR